VAPFVEEIPHGNFIDGGLLTLVLVSGVLAVGRRRKTLIVAGILVFPTVVGRWLNHHRPDLIPSEVFLVAGLVFAVFVVVNLLHFILRAPKVNSEVLCAGISCTWGGGPPLTPGGERRVPRMAVDVAYAPDQRESEMKFLIQQKQTKGTEQQNPIR
jgi:hypothetical protein